MFLSGQKTATLHAVRLIDIHGTRFYDLDFVHEGESGLRTARVGLESVYRAPVPGDRVLVTYLMNVVTGVAPAGG